MRNTDKQYHLDFGSEHGAKYIILPGDPGRVEKIASLLDNAKFYHQNREYLAWLGELEGEKVMVMSTGMGGPSTAIAVEELVKTGVEYFLRVGTCGGMQDEVMAGDIVIAQSAIRQEGTSKEYTPIEVPAVADFDFTLALRESAEKMGYRNHVGMVQCKDSFYGQHSPDSMPISKELNDRWQAYISAGCLASEMESAALFTVAAVRRVKSACILQVVWNQERAKKGYKDEECHDTMRAISCGVDAIRQLILKNKNK